MQSTFQSIEQLVQKLIGIMLFFNVDRLTVVIEIIEAELLRDEVDSLSKGELIYDGLKLPEKIDWIILNFSCYYSISEGLDHL